MSSLTVRSRERTPRDMLPVVICAGLILGLAYLAYDGIGWRLPMLLGAAAGAGALLLHPEWGPVVLVLAALAVPLQFGTGTEVTLNAATLLVPALGLLWLVRGLLTHQLAWRASPADRPWVLLLVAGLLSLGIGRATWDPAVPMKESFILVQLAQWAIYAFAALAYWLPGMLLRGPRDVERMTWVLLWVGGGLAILRLIPGVAGLVEPWTTIVYIRAPFLALMTGLAGGQLLFNNRLSHTRRLFLLGVLGAMIYASTFHGRLSISEWVGVWTVLAVLIWQRFPRLRGVAVVALVFLVAAGTLFPSLYAFAGGD